MSNSIFTPNTSGSLRSFTHDDFLCVPDDWFNPATSDSGLVVPELVNGELQEWLHAYNWRGCLAQYITRVKYRTDSDIQSLLQLSVMDETFTATLLDIVERQAYETVLEQWLDRTRFCTNSAEVLTRTLAQLINDVLLQSVRLRPLDSNPLALAVSGAYSAALIDNIDCTKPHHAMNVIRWFVVTYGEVNE